MNATNNARKVTKNPKSKDDDGVIPGGPVPPPLSPPGPPWLVITTVPPVDVVVDVEVDVSLPIVDIASPWLARAQIMTCAARVLATFNWAMGVDG